MKPEVRRALAKEWLILMAVAFVATLCRAGWLYCVNDQFDKTTEELRRDCMEWSKSAADSSKRVIEHRSQLQSNGLSILIPKDEDSMTAYLKNKKEECIEKLNNVAQDRLGYPHPRTTQGWIASATWAVEWSWLAYLALWVPRLTVSSIRLLRNSANKTARP